MKRLCFIFYYVFLGKRDDDKVISSLLSILMISGKDLKNHRVYIIITFSKLRLSAFTLSIHLFLD